MTGVAKPDMDDMLAAEDMGVACIGIVAMLTPVDTAPVDMPAACEE